MVYTWEALKKAYIAGQHFKFLFFWGHTPSADGLITEACLSQWWKCSFTADGTVYSCAEQFMMAEKARMFGDRDMLGNIMEAREPKAMKAYGRAVKNFDKETWDAACYELVRKGNMAKFSQNPELWEFLKTTKKRGQSKGPYLGNRYGKEQPGRRVSAEMEGQQPAGVCPDRGQGFAA